MIFNRFLLLCILVPQPAWALDVEETRHLLERAAFGARPAAVSVFAPLGREEAVDRLLDAVPDSFAEPEWADEVPLLDPKLLKARPKADRVALRRAFNQKQRKRFQGLKGWWYRCMLATRAPLVERMTLFWHNHFTSELPRVRSPQLMLR